MKSNIERPFLIFLFLFLLSISNYANGTLLRRISALRNWQGALTHGPSDNCRPPLSTDEFMRNMCSIKVQMTAEERKELNQLQMIYYLPTELPVQHRLQLELEDHRRRLIICNNSDTNDISRYPTMEHSAQLRFRYKIMQRVSEGGYAVVYSALDYMNKQQRVALKVNNFRRPQMVADEVDTLRHINHHFCKTETFMKSQRNATAGGCSCDAVLERRLTGMLDIVERYRDAWDVIVMPLFDSDWHRRTKAYDEKFRVVPLRELYQLTRDMITALQALQSLHIVHADVKPSNILYSDRHRASFLTDFGLAFREGMEHSESFRRGSLSFMAPEILISGHQHKPTHKIDVWALGATIFSILTRSSLVPTSGPWYAKHHNVIANLFHRVPPPLKSGLYDKAQQYAAKLTNAQRREMVSFDQILARRKVTYHYEDDFELYDDLEDFIKACLKWDPRDRMSIDEAAEMFSDSP